MKYFVVCAGLCFTTSLQAQTKALTFDDAVKIALQNSILLNQQKNILSLDKLQKTSSVLGLAPALSANANAYRINGNTFNSNTGEVVNGLFDQVYGSISASWTVFNGFSQVNRIQEHKALLDAQMFYVNRTAQDVIHAVAGQYLQIALDEELLLVAGENLTALEKQLEQIKEQVNLGSKAPADELNQDSQAKGAAIKKLQAQINLINDKALLMQTLLLDPTEEWEIIKPNWKLNDSTADNFSALFETALKNRGDYLRAKKNEEGARYAINVSRASMLPSLSLFGAVYSGYNKTHGNPTTRPFKTQLESDNLKKYCGVTLSLPIFSGLKNKTNAFQQRMTFLNSQLDRKNMESQVKIDVFKAYQNWKLYSQMYAAAAAQLKAAEAAYQLETERYNLGITNFVEFSNANRVFVTAKSDKAQAECRLLFQKVLVDYAVGTLKAEDY